MVEMAGNWTKVRLCFWQLLPTEFRLHANNLEHELFMMMMNQENNYLQDQQQFKFLSNPRLQPSTKVHYFVFVKGSQREICTEYIIWGWNSRGWLCSKLAFKSGLSDAFLCWQTWFWIFHSILRCAGISFSTGWSGPGSCYLPVTHFTLFDQHQAGFMCHCDYRLKINSWRFSECISDIQIAWWPLDNHV